MSLIGKYVITNAMDRKYNSKVFYNGRVKILDKVLMDKAGYSQSAVMNNASLDVYIGLADGNEIVLFKPDEITEIIIK